MTVLKVAAGVALGIAVAWGAMATYGYARKQIALTQCVAAVGHGGDVKVYEVIPCMALRGRRAVPAVDGMDWSNKT